MGEGNLKRGRPPIDDYPRREFVKTILAELKAQGISQTALSDRSFVRRGEKLVPVNRGTTSRVLSEEIPAPPHIRSAYMDFLGLPPELSMRFERSTAFVALGPKPMLIGDYSYPQQPALLTAKTLIHEGFYFEAAKELKRAFLSAQSSGNILLQADAAGRAALVHLEVSNFKNAAYWAKISAAKCSECAGVSVGEIVRSATSFSPNPSGDALASRILSETLHNYCQGLVRQVVYFERKRLEPAARLWLSRALELDRRLGLAQPAGNDLRCQAVLEVASESPESTSAIRLLDECRQNFFHGGLFEAHLVKTRAIIDLLIGQKRLGLDRLIQAERMLRSFPDGRGLALTMYLLSEEIVRRSLDNPEKRREALRTILSAAALHPYTPVVDRCREQARCTNPRDLQHEIDDLIAGKGSYAVVHRMMTWLAEGSAHSSTDLLFRNIDLMFAAGFPFVELPARTASHISGPA